MVDGGEFFIRKVTSEMNVLRGDELLRDDGRPTGDAKSCPWMALLSRRFVRLK
jgi:hypothetical protein